MLSCSPGLHCHFNPRSREGSDKMFHTTTTDYEYFNPRSREGSDDCSSDSAFCVFHISIHAPAKGATKEGGC